MEAGGRSPEERRAAAEARARARSGEPPATGDDELLGGTRPRGARGQVSRHYGGGDIYKRRRMFAAIGVVLVILVLLLLAGGC